MEERKSKEEGENVKTDDDIAWDDLEEAAKYLLKKQVPTWQETIYRLYKTADGKVGEVGVRNAILDVVGISSSVISSIEYQPRSETIKNLKMLSSLISYLEQTKDCHKIPIDRCIVNLKLLFYVIVVENSYCYKIIYNLMRACKGEAERDDFFDKKEVLPAQCKDKICNFGKNNSKEVPIFKDIVNLYGDLVDLGLRNSIAHGDYFIDLRANRIFIPGEMLHRFIDAAWKSKKETSYSFKTFHQSYQKATEYYEALLNILAYVGVSFSPNFDGSPQGNKA